MIKSALDYLRTNVIKERIIKPKDKEESIKYFNYPYQALEEAVVNALYHRDYTDWQPVEITVEPNRISILSYSGPDRSITMDSIKAAESLRSRRYRNVRLGDFLKELDLSEGRATGIPTIQEELKKNGSPRAVIETDEGRTYFLIDIYCHHGFLQSSNSRTAVMTTDLSQVCENLSQVLSQVYWADNQGSEDESVPSLSQVCLKSVSSWNTRATLTLVAKTLEEVIEPKTMRELLDLMGQTNRSRYMNLVVRPLIEMGYVTMTIPDQPNSSRQQYVLTPAGMQLLISNKD